MSKGDRSVTKNDRSKGASVTPQPPEDKRVTSAVTDVTDISPIYAYALRRAHGKLIGNSVTICHLSPDGDAARYATCADDEPGDTERPVEVLDAITKCETEIHYSTEAIASLTAGGATV